MTQSSHCHLNRQSRAKKISDNQNLWRIGWLIAILQGLSTLSLPGLYVEPWSWFLVIGTPLVVKSLLFVANILFITLPIAAALALWKRNRLAFIALAAFPITAWVFGTVPVPLLSNLYTTDVSINNWIITIVDGIAVLVGVYMFALTRREAATNASA